MDEHQALTVPATLHQSRLDAALAALMPGISRTAAGELIEDGAVAVNSRVVFDQARRVYADDLIEVTQKEPEPLTDEPQDLPFTELYRDDHLVVLDKPAGLTVHPARTQPDGTLMNALLFRYPASAALERAGIVHRLDRDTSGIMVVALSAPAQRVLKRAVSHHELVREYQAVVEGCLTAGGSVNAPLGRDPHNRQIGRAHV